MYSESHDWFRDCSCSSGLLESRLADTRDKWAIKTARPKKWTRAGFVLSFLCEAFYLSMYLEGCPLSNDHFRLTDGKLPMNHRVIPEWTYHSTNVIANSRKDPVPKINFIFFRHIPLVFELDCSPTNWKSRRLCGLEIITAHDALSCEVPDCLTYDRTQITSISLKA